MNRLRLCALLALAGCGPLGPLSGGELGGPLHTQSVADWSFVASETTCQLETNPADPHPEREIWIFRLDARPG